SHDVGDTWMSGYDLAANLRWHGRAGFNVVFITDHNVVSRESREASRESGVGGRPVQPPAPAWRSARGGHTSSCWATRCRSIALLTAGWQGCSLCFVPATP